MTEIHFAGINRIALAEVAEGRPILVSYADLIQRTTGELNPFWWNVLLPRLEAGVYPSVILDSGAFTELSEKQRGVKNPLKVDIESYRAFARRFGHLFTFVVTLDDIFGDLKRTWENTQALEDAGVEAVPVFHGNEPWSVLRHYCEKYGRVGLGFAREKGRIAKVQFDGLAPAEWLRTALAIVREHDGVKVHGFGMTDFANRYDLDLDTVDSTTWIAEYRGLRKTAGTHSCRWDRVKVLSDAQKLDFVLRSYEVADDGLDPIEIPSAFAQGQARTVLQRFTRPQLIDALAAVELPVLQQQVAA